jgi:glycosyltransferase involved in cell wall biosynthesis
MRVLAQLGHEVSLLTAEEPAPEALAGLSLAHRRTLDDLPERRAMKLGLSRLQERFRSYWGIDLDRIQAVRSASDDCQADAVVVVGLGVLPYLGAIEGPQRIWYAGDEWVWHHLSQVRIMAPRSWTNARDAAIKGLYEWAYASRLDRVWVVSEGDHRAMRRIVGTDKVDIVTNGVDGDHFQPVGGPEREQSCVFWGRLDFGPNIQALEWFCGRVWPSLLKKSPEARFTIYGFNATERVRGLVTSPGIELIPDLPDLRGEIGRHQVVVLPFVSGGGIKNKLLEAASMGKAIVCSPHAGNGVGAADQAPLVQARTAGQWVRALLSLWSDPERRRQLGEDARRWVVEHHTWEAAARAAIEGLERTSAGRLT